MFKWFKKRRETNCNLNAENNRLRVENGDLHSQLEAKNAELLEWRRKVEKIGEERDATAECLEDEQKRNMALEAKVDDLEAEIARLKESLGHAIHGLAAFQSFSDGIQKRLAMLPDQLGLPTPLAQEILGDFDQDLKEREAYAAKLERESITIEHDANDEGYLTKDGTRVCMKPYTVNEAILGTNSPAGERPSHWDVKISSDYDITSITELGVYKIPIDLGKQVTAEVRVWVVPTANKNL